MRRPTDIRGYSLIEILLVIAIIGILSSILVVAINPARQFAKARDTERETDLIAILSAVTQYSAEHSGALPDTDGDPDTSNFPTALTCIGTDPGCFDLAGAGDAGEEMVPVYMSAIPTDPQIGDDGDTGYSIYVDVNDRLVAEVESETKGTISITQ